MVASPLCMLYYLIVTDDGSNETGLSSNLVNCQPLRVISSICSLAIPEMIHHLVKRVIQ
jgi:hypothetical protein